ncbi:MAG: AraC family transcriptional regulator [Thermoanaerobacteraceae bacterium]|nr:AraC family transcriptional regulator [Thermoanaerobacteraceae bacterium]
MEDLKSRVAYLQGLSAGMNLEPDSKEGRLLSGIIDVLGEFANSFGRLEEAQEQLEDYVESIDEDLYSLEDEVYDGGVQDDEEYMEVECPRCGEIVCFDPEIVEDDDVIEVTCPNCDEVVFVNDDTYASADEPELLEGRVSRAQEEDDDL